jgi:hypothetical protein
MEKDVVRRLRIIRDIEIATTIPTNQHVKPSTTAFEYKNNFLINYQNLWIYTPSLLFRL